MNYSLYPSVGIARLDNGPSQFYLTLNRCELIISPGLCATSWIHARANFDKDSVPRGSNTTFLGPVTFGTEITHLGEIITDDKGRLIVLGATITCSALNEIWLQTLV
ncbi:hypothetical protein J8M20_05600 [Pseudoalteromonas luteoviolacea]|uniref:LodA/GoxA family CTQ-dependent oxidase n=1 Tax=Pseudoalteromonas luteoviolacea TaxID=43657 RepID=UPI001B3897A7|nr:LodA/GoxA family CTQ-dependent oxidase [Pseudoalteromonas luteoviolacea]MBQ4810799.1 hypothetical protein [Pseudoalteromonas luteoviolacea]